MAATRRRIPASPSSCHRPDGRARRRGGRPVHPRQPQLRARRAPAAPLSAAGTSSARSVDDASPPRPPRRTGQRPELRRLGRVRRSGRPSTARRASVDVTGHVPGVVRQPADRPVRRDRERRVARRRPTPDRLRLVSRGRRQHRGRRRTTRFSLRQHPRARRHRHGPPAAGRAAEPDRPRHRTCTTTRSRSSSTTAPTIDDVQWNDFPGGTHARLRRPHLARQGSRLLRSRSQPVQRLRPPASGSTPAAAAPDPAERRQQLVQHRGRGRAALGYGDYVVTTVGRLDLLDPQAVFGIFLWQYVPCYDSAYLWWNPYDEIDIEYGRWGMSRQRHRPVRRPALRLARATSCASTRRSPTAR